MASSSASRSACASSGFSWRARCERGGVRDATGLEGSRVVTTAAATPLRRRRATERATSARAASLPRAVRWQLRRRRRAARWDGNGHPGRGAHLQLLDPLRVRLQRRPECGRVGGAAVLVQAERRVRHGCCGGTGRGVATVSLCLAVREDAFGARHAGWAMWLLRLAATVPRYLAVRRRRARRRQHVGLPVSLLSEEDSRALGYALGAEYGDPVVRAVCVSVLCRRVAR